MRKNVLLIGAMLMASMSMMAQTKGGGISQSALQQMEKNHACAAHKALFNAVANNNIDDLVKNHANEAPVDTHFSIETDRKSVV